MRVKYWAACPSQEKWGGFSEKDIYELCAEAEAGGQNRKKGKKISPGRGTAYAKARWQEGSW